MCESTCVCVRASVRVCTRVYVCERERRRCEFRRFEDVGGGRPVNC